MSQPYTYRPNMTRNVTRKWAEARQVDYDGDDWGGDPYDGDDYEPTQPAMSQGGRSFTNPPALNTNHRLSFDQGQEQRIFSAGAAGSHAGFPSTIQPSSRAVSNPQYGFPQPPSQMGASQSFERPSFDSQRRADPSFQPTGSSAEARSFPPRKSSLSQSDVPDFSVAQSSRSPTQAEDKPLPFIRPADIYKRMEEERQKERLSQESSRPSLDSVQRAGTEGASNVEESQRRTKTDLDPVPERKSEYGMEGLMGTSHTLGRSEDASHPDTRLGQAESSIPDPTITDSVLSSEQGQHDSRATQRPALPELGRMSTFGSDFFRSNVLAQDRSSSSQPTQLAQQQARDIGTGQTLNNAPYRNVVDTAFESEHGRRGSPSVTDDSLLRSDTTSTSQISPIVSRHVGPGFGQDSAGPEPASSTSQVVEDLGTPRRLGTNRRDSPSPARKPSSMVAPTVSEPQSAVLSPSDQNISKDTATEAQIIRPGPAILVHQRATSSESIPKTAQTDSTGRPASALRNQPSQVSERSDLSDQRTASEEWRDWSNQRNEFNAKHGFKDSNPTTPGLESGMLAPAPPLASLDRNLSSGIARTSNEDEKPLPAMPNHPESSRPQVWRDESFRPQLPGGWESSTSIQRAAPPSTFATNQQQTRYPAAAMRTESAESIPTAGAPREANWRSQYTGPQAQAFANAQAAGKAMAGIFNGPALTSRGGDSEVSSINDQEEHPTGNNHDSTLFARDFASATPPPPAVPDQYATRDFASLSSPAREVSETTPKASQRAFAAERASTKSTSSNRRRQLIIGGARGHSPSRDSEKNWWSDDDDDDDTAARADAPAPLRTNRLSTVESHERKSPSLRHHPRVDSEFQDQLESDIVKSLTPKSSNIDNTGLGDAPRLSPTRTNEHRGGSPPFAAAALALSPGRSNHALQEQNTFKPLSDPDTPTSQRSASGPGLGGNVLGGPSSRVTAPTEHQSAFTTGSNLPTLGQTSFADSTIDNRKASQVSQPSQGGAKAFSIIPDGIIASHSSPTGSKIRHDLDRSRESPPTEEEHASGDSRKIEKAALPAIAAAGVGALAHEHESQANKSARGPETIVPRSADATSTTPAKSSVFGGPVQPPSGPSVITGESALPPSTPQKAPQELSSTSSPSAVAAAQNNRNVPYDPNRSFPADKVPIEKIFGMGTAQERIQAYNENREVYTQPVGHLENWLSHMNTGEHADAFVAAPLAKTEHGTPNSRHRREDSTPSGTKQMQEDGKKLLASASKYGAKAGVLGKGLLSKGKEKLRTVSASQKGGTTNRKPTDRPEYDRSVSTSDSSAPQLPTPVSSTPLGESSFSAYFPAKENSQIDSHGSRAAVEPPFSPISEVSTNQNELGRSVSAVSEDPSNTTPRQTDVMATPTHTSKVSREDSKSKTVVGLSAMEPNRGEGRVSTDRVNPVAGVHDRANSSVSDVSSVSDTLDRRRSHATRTISPPIEHQISRNDAPSVSPMPLVMAAENRNENQRSHHAPSYSTAMASKEEEAGRDRVDEQPLPAYNQSGQPKASRIAPGTQIVPIARLRQDHEVRAEEPRPFSFVGSESLLHTSHGTNHSIDNPGINTGSFGQDNRGEVGQQRDPASSPAAGPGMFDNNVSGHRNQPSQPSRILTQTQAQEQYRIPGPYGHELRSPRPKGSSPMAEQFKSPTSAMTPMEAFAASSSAQRAGMSDYTPFPPQNPPQQQRQNQHHPLPAASMVDSRPGLPQIHPSKGDRYDGDSDYTDDRDYDDNRDRGRPSKLSALFKSRSKSRSRRMQKENQREQRPDNSRRRSSLFKLGSRNSMQRDDSYNEPVPQVPGERFANANRQSDSRPEIGGRRESNSQIGAADHGQADYVSPIAHGFATSHKRKRFSGLFGKSQTQVPTRASTMPSQQQQQQPMPDQMSGARRPNGPQSAEVAKRHVTFDETHDSRPQVTSTQGPGFHNQTTLPHGSEEAARQRDESYQQFSGDRNVSQAGPSMAGGRYGPSRQNTNQSDTEPYNNWLLAQNNEHPEQSALHSNAPFSTGPQAGLPYQHENRPHAYGNDNQHQHDPTRPVLPRLNTGENHASGGVGVPASAPPVPSSYLQGRQTEGNVPQHTNILPQHASSQQYNQLSFPQPPSLAQYSQPQTTHTAGDFSRVAGMNNQTHPSLLRTANNDYDDHQMTSPLPVSPGFSDSNTLVQPLPGAFNPMPGHYRANENMVQPTSSYSQQPVSRISPHVAQLHVRSRSPKLGRRSSDDLDHEFETANNSLGVNAPGSDSTRSPVAGLGTFRNKGVSPVGGIPRSAEEQEKPWAIALPTDEEERRLAADDPQSATSSKAREMRRLMLERGPAVPSEDSTQASMTQSGTTGGPVQEPRTSAPKTAIVSPPVETHGLRSNEHEPVASNLPVVTSPSQGLGNEPIVPARPANKPSRIAESENPMTAMPGTQRVVPPVRKTTPITIGRPTTPSFMLRRDASLRGKGPRTSTSIDEAGRTSIMTGLANRSATPTSMTRQDSRSTSADLSKRSRSSSWNSKDASHQQHDPTIPGRPNAIATATPGAIGESGSPVPPVPSIPAMQKDRVVSGHPGDQSREPGHGPFTAVAASPSIPSTDTATVDTRSNSTGKAPIIPTTTNMPSDSAKKAANPLAIDTNRNANANVNKIGSPSRNNKSFEVYEMMGSRPDGYESEDEPMMSATAYPGQEWQPVFDRWED